MGNIDYTKNPLVKKFIEVEASENKIKNIFLFAGGGYGKTTAMCCLFKYLLDKASNGEKIVPIYIDVKKLNFNETNPIISYIHSKYSGSDTKESDVKNLFSDQAPEFSKKYTYYVLIDGLNETSDRNKSNLIDIISVMTEISNVRFVVSSRIKEIFDKAPFCTFEMQKLNEEQIKDYLDKNFGEKYNEQTKVKRINKSLVEILQIPMFMKTFSKTYDKRSPYPDIYDEKTVRKADILDSYIQKILLNLKERTSSYDNNILEFVINFYLPALAFQMAEENVLNIDSEIVDKKLCSNYFLSFFKGNKKEQIKFLINDKKFMPISISSKNFALINDNDGDYSFVHQIWRDFFAAKHIINCMNIERLDELEISVDENIRQFVGELIREYVAENKYSKEFSYEQQIDKDGKVIYVEKLDTRKCECDFEEKDNLETWSESPIEHFLQQHNMNSAKSISPLVTRNLVEIMKISRNNHISANYSELDLTNANFCATNCCNSNFKGSRINSSTFNSYLDNISMDFVSISADNKLIIIVDEVIDKAIVLDINTGAVIKSFDYLDWRDDYCLYDRKPIFLYEDDYAHDYEIIETIRYENCIYKIYFEEISNRVDYYDNFDVEIIEDSTFVLTNHGNTTIKTAYYDNNVSVISFSGDGNRLISGNEQGVINIWKIESSKNVYEPLYSLVTDSEVKSISISDDNSYMITVHKNGEIIVWDYGSLKIKNIYARRSFPILNSYFIDNNNCIVLCYCEYGNHLIVLIYDLKQKRIVKGFNKSINGHYVVSSITNKCAYIDNKGVIHIFDYISNGEITIKPNNSMILKKSYIRSFSPDGRYILLKNVYFEDENMTIEKYLIYDLNLRKCVFVLNEDDCVTFDSSFYFVNGEWKTFTDNAKASISVDDEYATFLFQYKNDHYLAFENAENQIFETIGCVIPAIITGSNFQNVDLSVNNEKEFLETLLINGGAVDKSFDINIDYNNLQIQSRKNIRFNTELVNVFTDNIKENHIKKYALSEYFEDNKMHNQHCHFILNKLDRIFGCDIVYYYDDVLFVIDNFHFQIYYLSPNLKILYRSIEYYFSSNELVFVATGEKNYIVTFSLDLKQFRLIHIHKKYINLFIYDYLLHTNYIEIRNFCVDNGIEYLYGSNLKELSFYVFEIINNKCIELIVQKLELDYFINIYIEESHAYFIEKKEDGLFNIETIISNSKIEHEYTFKITDVYLENKEKTTYYLTLKGEKYKHFFACEDRFFYKEIRFDSRKKELYFYNNQID